jgi:glycosyltransferase involved in cell wall biosynthesis
VRIVIASTHVPFVRGGGTKIVEDTRSALQEAGHDVDVVSLPVWEHWEQIPAQLSAMRLFDLTESSDRLIAIRTPSHLLRHPSKVVWFLHHHRGAYDLWGTQYQDIPDTTEGLRVRELIQSSDAVGLAEAKHIFCNAETTRDRLARFSGITSEVLLPPLSNAQSYRWAPDEGYVFFPSRITPAKRQELAVAAMAHVRCGLRLVIAGAADTPDALTSLERAIDKWGVRNRVTLLSHWITEEEKRSLFSKATACLFVPFDEDSYGYVSLESYHSGKPVITCSDAGGVLELVRDGQTGLVAEPSPESIAAAIDQIASSSPRRRREMGAAGLSRIADLGISWERVVDWLTQ